MKKKVGFIGLGKMGQPIAKRLLEAQFPLLIWNRTSAKTHDLVKEGAVVANSAKELAAQSEVIITMVSDGNALKAVAFGEDGIIAGAKSETILVDMSTVDPDGSRDVAQAAVKRGVKMLRAPVMGSVGWAATGELTVLASGDKDAYEQCQNLFDAMAQKTYYLGPGEEARYMKLATNAMLGVTCQMLAEVLTLGEKAGLDLDQMIEIIGEGGLASPFINVKLGSIAKRDFSSMFTGSMMAKDYDLVLDASKNLDVLMPTVSLVRQFLGGLKATGRGELDFSALFLLMEELSGIKQE